MDTKVGRESGMDGETGIHIHSYPFTITQQRTTEDLRTAQGIYSELCGDLDGEGGKAEGCVYTHSRVTLLYGRS